MPHGADNIEIFHLLLNKVYVGGHCDLPNSGGGLPPLNGVAKLKVNPRVDKYM